MVCGMAERQEAAIHFEAERLFTVAMDIRACAGTTLARVRAVFGPTCPRTAILFANKRSTRRRCLCAMALASGWQPADITRDASLLHFLMSGGCGGLSCREWRSLHERAHG